MVFSDISFNTVDNWSCPFNNQSFESILLVKVSVHKLLHRFTGSFWVFTLFIKLHLKCVHVSNSVLKLLQSELTGLTLWRRSITLAASWSLWSSRILGCAHTSTIFARASSAIKLAIRDRIWVLGLLFCILFDNGLKLLDFSVLSLSVLAHFLFFYSGLLNLLLKPTNFFLLLLYLALHFLIALRIFLCRG